jgi:hypothetical protein
MDAFIANGDSGSRNQLLHLVLRLAAKRAAKVSPFSAVAVVLLEHDGPPLYDFSHAEGGNNLIV